MTTNAEPSRDPADNDDLTGVFKTILRKWLQSVDDCLPGIVIAVDRTVSPNVATVQPLIQLKTTANQRVSRAQIVKIPIFQIGGGGFVLNFPVKPGNMGWIKANDRDISLFMQSEKEAAPNTNRLHTFADAVFFPDAMFDYTIADEDVDRVVFQSNNGSAKISIGTDSIRLKVGAEVLELSAAGLMHNGVNVGSTHEHGGVEPGGGNTDGPH